jgi:hypothetical protein
MAVDDTDQWAGACLVPRLPHLGGEQPPADPGRPAGDPTTEGDAMSTTATEPIAEPTIDETVAEPTPTTDAGGAGEGVQPPKDSAPQEDGPPWKLSDELAEWIAGARVTSVVGNGMPDYDLLLRLLEDWADKLVDFVMTYTNEDTLHQMGVHTIQLPHGPRIIAVDGKQAAESTIVHAILSTIAADPELRERVSKLDVASMGTATAVMIRTGGAPAETAPAGEPVDVDTMVHETWKELLDKAIADGAPAEVIESYRKAVEETAPKA